jgi:uncharacterized Zn-binding protein involved in type VI secretion
MEPMIPDAAKANAQHDHVGAQRVIARYAVATTGARTRDGGTLMAGSSSLAIDERNAGLVGDTVVYPDGAHATIISGAGFAITDRGGIPVAIVGSHLSNGDLISASPNDSLFIYELEGEPPIPGLLDPSYGARAHAANQERYGV